MMTTATDAGANHVAQATIFEGHHRGLREGLEALADAIAICRQKAAENAAAPAAGEGKRLSDCLATLRQMADIHFTDEEKFMEDVGFPGLASHARDHRDLLAWLDSLCSVDSEALCRADPVQQLAAWWEAHAQGPDRALADFLCRGGI